MNGRSHPDHENRQKNVEITRVPRFRAPPGTAGQVGVTAFIFPEYAYPDSDVFPGKPDYEGSSPQCPSGAWRGRLRESRMNR